MIYDVLNYIRQELRDRLQLPNDEITLQSAHVLASGSSNLGTCVTLVNIEEDVSARNRPPMSARVRQSQPSPALNLYLLFSFEYPSYETSLRHLSATIELFEEKSVYTTATAATSNPFPAGVEKLMFQLHNVDFERLNALWGTMGRPQVPSLLYKVHTARRAPS